MAERVVGTGSFGVVFQVLGIIFMYPLFKFCCFVVLVFYLKNLVDEQFFLLSLMIHE